MPDTARGSDPELRCDSDLQTQAGALRGDNHGTVIRGWCRARGSTPSAACLPAECATAMIATAVTAIAAQSTVLDDWLMPAGAAIGAAIALLIRVRRVRHKSATRRRAS